MVRLRFFRLVLVVLDIDAGEERCDASDAEMRRVGV